MGWLSDRRSVAGTDEEMTHVTLPPQSSSSSIRATVNLGSAVGAGHGAVLRTAENPAPGMGKGTHGVPSGSAGPALIKHYADLPQYVRLLTGGEDPVYRLPLDQQELLIAADLGGKRVNIIRAEVSRSEVHALQAHLRALKGDLRAKGYQIAEELVASRGVMQVIMRNAGKSTSSAGKGEPVRLFNRWLELAARADATDLHVEVRGNVGHVRIRVHGRLEKLPDGNGGTYSRADVIDALAAGYNNTRQGNNVSQYTEDKFVACMIALNLPGLTGHLRYQNFKGRSGPKAVIRILRSGESNAITFEGAGYAPSQLKLLREAGRSGKGIVLIAGVTSSGKSTSLKCLIETLPGLESKAIYTVEDPIEYEIRGAHQIEVLRDLADEELTESRYADTMRALLRGDPDGVMLGEIRDRLTAMFALQIAETGHLAMGTVHAHLLSTIVPRLTNDQIGVSRQALTGPNILNLLIYQALVPRLCRSCADHTDVAAARDADIAELVGVLKTRFKVCTTTLRWQHPGGCAVCQGRGTCGKTLVAEMLRPDRTWLRLVRQNDDDAAVTHFRSASDGNFFSPDMTGKTVFEHTLWKALQGEVDVRNCEEFDSFTRFELTERRTEAAP
ncbi:MAG: hypothetical protein RLZZ618_3886 [Pseudomonadota bacterium]|jgi:type II secretory ATPase GspE/PulE/Tfp pilus assembly ATPase PilB-like protein